MVDERIKKVADILVNYSLTVKKGYIIDVSFGYEARDLGLEVCKLIIKKGAFPRPFIALPGFAYTFFKHATTEMLETKPKIALYEANIINGSVSLGGSLNTKELTSIDSKKIAIRSKVMQQVSEIHLKKNNWILFEYPTYALAQDAEMSLEEFQDFVFNSVIVDWKKVSKQQDKLKAILDKGEKVRIIGEETDLTFSIKGRQGIKCDGKRNMPDGEVFCAPVDDSANGYITYTFPAIKNGKEVDGVRLEFKDGKVVKATAKKNQSLLDAMLNTDPGAKRLGEFGIGVNYNIKKFVKQILFDEKIGGTIHLALGRAYKEGHGKNNSAIHWDMIKDLRNGGELWIDGKLIQKNGKFTFNL